MSAHLLALAQQSARLWPRRGCHIALAARRADALEAVKRRLVVREGKVITRPTDVTDRTQVEALVKAAEAELGPVDILVSCAGVMYFTMMQNVHIEEWERTVDVNCKGLLHLLVFDCAIDAFPGKWPYCRYLLGCRPKGLSRLGCLLRE